MQKILNNGLEASKDLLEKAGAKAKEMGDKGVLKFEIMQLEKSVENNLLKLGSYVYEEFVANEKKSISQSNSKLGQIIDEINQAKDQIEEKEEKLKDS
ncbi:MAG: hypothetical protein JXR70_07260 [Spirochaetales bacterium]|nr:hypothetical protein [Spirochaetales bacterium]